MIEKSTPVRLLETLENPTVLCIFADFLQGEFNIENLLFYSSCARYCQLEDQDEINLTALDIYDKHIPMTADRAVSLSSGVHLEITRTIRAGPPYARTLYQKAQAEAFMNMQIDPFPRFLNSVAYSALLNQKMTLSKLTIPEQVLEECLKEARDDWGMGIFTKLNVTLHRKHSIQLGQTAFKYSARVKAPMEKTFDLISDMTRRQEWDPHFDYGELVEELDEDIAVVYLVWKSSGVLKSSRDFVAIRVERRNPSACVVVLRTVVHKEAPETKIHTRAELTVSCYIVQQDPENPDQCLLTNIVHVRSIMLTSS